MAEAPERPVLSAKTTLPSSSNVKVILLTLAFVIVGGTLWYTHELVASLEKKERDVADLYARALEYLAGSNSDQSDYSFVLDEIIRAIDFPIIQTDSWNEPVQPYLSNIKNIPLDTAMALSEQRAFLKSLIAEMGAKNPPITVTVQDTIILNYLHYGESPLITRLRWLPYIEFGVVAIFIFIGYMSFSYIKRSEQSNIWVGMARETAHQLGTPISSMMGWVELLRHQLGDREVAALETLRDMENDLQRLQKIAARFSKIGSKPDLKDENIGDVIEHVIRYFERRIPQSGKRVQLSLQQTEPVFAKINRELFEWVIENLIKNALDAIEGTDGAITISLTQRGKSILIDVNDTGRGVNPEHRKDIFRPGYSTRSRGWGLGLSLSKRIVDSYHNGKLTLKESKVGHGTTFRIKLRA
jgi:anti-sigma regulatory factor (Ser/Thr protein kinase)